MDKVDILIVGGGLTGCALLLALRQSGLKVLLVDNKTPSHITPDFLDTRTITLSEASIRILTNLKLWDKLASHANAITKIHVSQQASFGITRFSEPHDKPLGYVANILAITQVLQHELPAEATLFNSTVTEFNPETKIATINAANGMIHIQTKLLVAADGSNSKIRDILNLAVNIKDYQQSAIVTNILLNKPHNNCAYERFTHNGPIAALPMTDNRIGFVWCMQNSKAEAILKLGDAEFLKLAHQNFSNRLGKFIATGSRMLYPLQQYIMPNIHKASCVFIGNAAQTLHPVAGQGFNLGLRDAVSLAECIHLYGLDSLMLDEYAKLRQHDKHIIGTATDKLITIFAKKFPGMQHARGLGLLALDNCLPLQKIIAHYAKGFGGHNPKLIYQDTYE